MLPQQHNNIGKVMLSEELLLLVALNAQIQALRTTRDVIKQNEDTDTVDIAKKVSLDLKRIRWVVRSGAY